MRLNIKYLAIEYRRENNSTDFNKLRDVCNLMKFKTKQYPKKKIIVYCIRTDTARLVAKKLRCSTYYTNIRSDKKKQEIRLK